MFILIKRTKYDTLEDSYNVVATAKTLESARMKKNALNILAKER